MVDGGDRAPVATFVGDSPLVAGQIGELSEAAAHHARVKRLEVGDPVRMTDGAGAIAIGTIVALKKAGGGVRIDEVAAVPRPAGIHVRVPIGDRDRMLWLAEKATELGVESWQGVRYHRSMSVTPRGEGPAFAEKLRARMFAALEQSGGAWLPRILPDAAPDAIDVPDAAVRVLLDVGGVPLIRLFPDGGPQAAVITFGPEGGLERAERALLAANGWQPARLAPTTLRFETAGVAAISVVRAAHILQES